jgi:hypothetical protein
MKALWQMVAIGALGVVAYQWFCVGDQLVHGAVLILKTGWSVPVLTVGIGMLNIFVLLTAVAVAIGALATWRLRQSSPPFARCARIATYGLLGGATLWLGLIASPLVDVVQRCRCPTGHCSGRSAFLALLRRPLAAECQVVRQTATMDGFEDDRLNWDALDPLVLSGAKLEFIVRVREATSVTLPDAQDILVRRYDVLRRSRPQDFAQSHEDYWAGFYS